MSSQNQSPSPQEIISKSILTGFMNSAITKPTKQTEATKENISRQKANELPFKPHFLDSENLFPQTVAWLKLNSATNGAIIRSKVSISKGQGLKYFDLKGNEIEKDQVKGNTDFLDNPSKEQFYSIEDLFEDSLDEFITQGQFYGICKKVTVGGAESFTAKILQGTKPRLSKDGKSIIVNPYWDLIKLNQNSEYYRDYTKTYQLWDFTGEMPNEFAFHYKRRESGYDYYGVPDYWSGAKDAINEYLVDVYNNARLENGQFTQAYITYVGNPPEGKDANQYLEEMYEKMGGAHNAGKPYMNLVSDKAIVPQVDFAPNNNEGEFLNLEESAYTGIVRAHRWFPSLAGIATSGQLGSNQQIRNEYSIAISQVVPDYQKPVLKVLNKILELAGVQAKIDVINRMPISFDDQIDPEMVMTVNEARKQLKLPMLPDDYAYNDSASGEYFGDMLIQDMRNRLNIAQRQRNGSNN